MDLLSALQRKKAPPPDAGDGVQLARTRARQRLIGAAVLVAVGIIGFPLLFETQPRPIPVDLPIEIPRQDGSPPLVLSPPPPSSPQASTASTSGKGEPASGRKNVRSAEAVIDETAADAGRELAPAAPPTSAASQVEPSQTVARAPARPPQSAAPKADSASAVRTTTAATRQVNSSTDDGARAKSLLEGQAVSPIETPSQTANAQRFVVQVGAFADAAAVKAARSKVEKLGLATYTQVAETPAGSRTRVRVGPFATRAEAERAAARIKAADLPTVILTL